jgi:hypothetical protein
MRFIVVAVLVVGFTLACAQKGDVRDEGRAQPQPAKKYRPDTPVTPKAMQPVPSSF